MERGTEYDDPCASSPDNEFLGGCFDARATSWIADGISAFRQINGRGNLCSMSLVHAPRISNFDFIGGKYTGIAHGWTYS